MKNCVWEEAWLVYTHCVGEGILSLPVSTLKFRPFHCLQLPHQLDECDTEGSSPLNLALLSRHEGIANTLVSHKCHLDTQVCGRVGSAVLLGG